MLLNHELLGLMRLAFQESHVEIENITVKPEYQYCNATRKYKHVGAGLIAHAVRLSLDHGFDGATALCAATSASDGFARALNFEAFKVRRLLYGSDAETLAKSY